MLKPHYNLNHLQSETESLNTDVMRFMAIIGFCMMIVFAVAQGVYNEKDRQSQASLPMLKQGVMKKTPPVEAPVYQWVKKQKQKQQQRKKRKKRIQPTSKMDDIVKPDTSKKGFSLEFESVNVLEQLIQNNTVKLYALANKTFWRISLNSQEIQINKSKKSPKVYYEMHRNTVPRKIIQSMNKQAQIKSQVLWGIELPSIIRDQVDTLLKTASGGRLIILPDGTTVLR